MPIYFFYLHRARISPTCTKPVVYLPVTRVIIIILAREIRYNSRGLYRALVSSAPNVKSKKKKGKTYVSVKINILPDSKVITTATYQWIPNYYPARYNTNMVYVTVLQLCVGRMLWQM